MKKHERVKSNIEFNDIIQKGKKISNKYFTIFFVEKKEKEPKFGIAASKKLGNAVIRNKMKRQVRMIVNDTKLLFKKNRNYIIIIKRECLQTPYALKLESLKKLIGEHNEK